MSSSIPAPVQAGFQEVNGLAAVAMEELVLGYERLESA
jgi:hypothetical protein